MTRICPIASATLRVGLRGDPVTHSARLACPEGTMAHGNGTLNGVRGGSRSGSIAAVDPTRGTAQA
jgi:hypothetical protein